MALGFIPAPKIGRISTLKDLEKMPEKNLIVFLKDLFDDSNEGILPLFLDNQGRKVPYARHLYGKAKSVAGAVVVVDLISKVEEAHEIINKDEDYLDDITVEVFSAPQESE